MRPIPSIDFCVPMQNASLPPRSRDRFAARARQAPRGEQVFTHDQRPLRLRSIEPADVAALQRCFVRLSPEDIRRRFLHAMSELPMPMAQRLARIDPALETALVLVDETVSPEEIRGVGRLYLDKVTDNAEFSVLVEQKWARSGLGALLMQRLVDDGRRRGISEIWGCVLQENRPMLELCKELGFSRHLMANEPGTTQLTLRLN